MTLSINQNNYATPAGSYANLYSANVTVQPYRFLSLSDNVLDGSCHPLGVDYVWWGASLSDENGLLTTPVELVMAELNETLLCISLIGDIFEDNYPVDYTVSAYKDGELLVTDTVVGNRVASISHQMSEVHTIDTCVVTITRISKANSVAKLTNAFHPHLLIRRDAVPLNIEADSLKSEVFFINGQDSMNVSVAEDTHIINNMRRLYKLPLELNDTEKLTNVHTKMKETTRNILGRVEITYTDPLIDGRINISSSGAARGSSIEQASNTNTSAAFNYFSLYDNKLDGTYHCIGDDSEVGWWSKSLSDTYGEFITPPTLTFTFLARPIFSVTVIGDAIKEAYPVDFDIVITANSVHTTVPVRGNTDITCVTDITGITNATSITLVFYKVNKPNYPAVVVEVPLLSTVSYEGDGLMSINMLEEVSYEDESEALGGVSANELTVVLSNEDRSFYFNNDASYVSKYLKKNRKVKAWLGVDIDGMVEWYSLGTYWSYKWDVPIGTLTASVVAFDTLGLLNTMLFYKHNVFVDASIGSMIEYILTDAKEQFSALEWQIEQELYDVKIPYCWFEYASHMAALKQLSLSYPLHIYCDRDGKVIAKVQRIHLDYLYDTWSEHDNIISTSYPTLYTASPNLIEVSVMNTKIENTQVISGVPQFNVQEYPEKTLVFSGPCIGNLNVAIDCDDTVTYNYEEYSWGIIISFRGTGNVYNITATADMISAEQSTIITNRDDSSIILNGTVKRSIQSNFIQTPERASYIADRIASLTAQDKYDAEVQYRGDIALSIDNPIILKESIAPVNKYNIVRHELHWDGGLSGTATLNT